MSWSHSAGRPGGIPRLLSKSLHHLSAATYSPDGSATRYAIASKQSKATASGHITHSPYRQSEYRTHQERRCCLTTPSTCTRHAAAARLSVAVKLLQNTSARHTLAQAASAVNLSASRLRHLIRQHVGISPSHLVRTARLRLAHHLLTTTTLSLKEVMWTAAFADCNHSIRSYKTTYAETPSQTRLNAAVRHAYHAEG